MAASDHINQALFHGTSAQLNVGDVIEPRSMNYNVGAPAAWASNNPELAKYYAYEKMGIDKVKTAPVYQVEPVDKEEKLREFPSKGDTYFASTKGFRVLGVHDTANWDD